MGSIFSIDSLSSVDETINGLVFQPPKPPKKEDFFNMENNDRIKIRRFVGQNVIMGIEVTPTTIKQDKIIIYSHGNAEDVIQGKNFALQFSELFGIKMVIYDYPGYGLSEGNTSEKGCYDALDTVIEHYKTEGYEIILMGRSLGTGVTVDCASRQKNWSNPIILISAYKSIPRVISDYPVESFVQKYSFSSIYKINKLKCPVKLIHGIEDRVISHTHSVDLFEKLKNKSMKLTLIKKADHDNVFDFVEIISSLTEAINYNCATNVMTIDRI